MDKAQEFLDAAGITQTELAEALGVTPAAISRKLGGLRNWRLAEIQAVLAWLSGRLGRVVSYDEVFGRPAAAAPVVGPDPDPSSPDAA